MNVLSFVSRNLLKTGCARRAAVRCFGQPAAQTHPHLIQEGEVTPGLTKEELYWRRYRLMEVIERNQARLSPNVATENHIVIVPAAAKSYMTHDIPYLFRQNTDFLYLCGFLEPDSILVLESKLSSLPKHTCTLFVPKKDPHRELWDGLRSGIAGALELTGVDYTYNIEEFENYLNSYLKDNTSCTAWYEYKSPSHLEHHNKHISRVIENNHVSLIRSPKLLIQSLRVIKSPAEKKLMQKTCDVAANAFVEVMRMSHPEVNESHLYAKMDYECRINGAEMLAYPPVIAGGSRANTIHYISNNQLVSEGDLVLMDAGCEVHGYSSDITRTWPVSGHFKPAQRDLYEALLEVQENCIKLCGQANMTMEEIFLSMLFELGSQLQRLGIVDAGVKGMELQRKARHFCPHHVSHYLGMDVHDTDEISRGTLLMPGMCITIEPGVYIPETNTDVPEAFRGLGIRIEDDVFITSGEPVVLTASCPKHPDDIEKIVQSR